MDEELINYEKRIKRRHRLVKRRRDPERDLYGYSMRLNVKRKGRG